MSEHIFSDVKYGSTGIDVIVLQSFFHSAMYIGSDGKVIDIDGECGKNTVFAINTFKRQNKIYNCGDIDWKEDGIFNAECWRRLGLYVSLNRVKEMHKWAVNECDKLNVGYSQEYRNAQTVNGITYYDCSSFVYFALYHGGFNVDPKAWAFTTYNMQSVLKNLGFKEYKSSSLVWKDGDILWSQEHTEIVYKGTNSKGEGYTMGAHGKTNRALENQVSINNFTSNYNKYPLLYRFEE